MRKQELVLELEALRQRLEEAEDTVRAIRVQVASEPEEEHVLVLNGADEVTERKKAEESGAFLAAIVDSSEDAIFGRDLNGTILTWNPGAERLLGYSAQEIIGHSSSILQPPDRADEFLDILEHIGRGEPIRQLETERVRKDGRRIPVSLTVSPIRNSQGHIEGASTIARDITERKLASQEVVRLTQDLERRVAERTIQLERAAAELEKRNREVERANRMKSEFLARCSHELRTPLNAIIGYSDLLSEQSAGPLPAPYPRFVANIQEGARHLLHMVNDLLDLSRIEAGRIELNLEKFDISAALDEVLSVITPLAEIKSISVENRVARGTALLADRVRFKQILYNLMSNAVKFTPEEGRAWIETATDGEMFTICVGDTGIGIALEEQEAIFEEFHQVASPGNAAAAGAGLGLAITRKLARLLGGDVYVESRTGKGSRFLVSLPVSGESIAPERMEADAQGVGSGR